MEQMCCATVSLLERTVRRYIWKKKKKGVWQMDFDIKISTRSAQGYHLKFEKQRNSEEMQDM